MSCPKDTTTYQSSQSQAPLLQCFQVLVVETALHTFKPKNYNNDRTTIIDPYAMIVALKSYVQTTVV